MARTISPRARVPLAAAALACALAIPGAALAQQPPPRPTLDPNAAEAEEQFVSGREAVKRGELRRAAQLFRRSQELHPAAGTLLNLASVEEQLGHAATALDLFQTALTQLADGDDRIQVAKEGMARLAPRVPYLKLERAAGAPPSTRIAIDEAPIAASGVGADQPMNPGTYTVIVTAPGHEARRYEVKLGDGQHVALAVEPGKAFSVTGALPQQQRERTSLTQPIGFAVGGVGLAGLGIGAVTGILAVVKRHDLDAACPVASRCNAGGLRIEATGTALATVSTASLVLGLAGVGAGVTLVLVGRSQAKPAAASVAVGVTALAGGGYVGARGVF